MTALAAAPGVAPDTRPRKELAAAPAGARAASRGGLGTAPSLERPMSESPHGEPTLDDLVAGVWEELAVRGLARCPLCGGEMQAEVTPLEIVGAAGLEEELGLHAILRGVCQDCGTELD